jgi:hypothetical protein
MSLWWIVSGSQAQDVTVDGLYNTGVYNDGTVLPDGSVDPHAEIVAHKRREIEPWLADTADWHARATALGPFGGFRKALVSGQFGVIGDVKKASPSAGNVPEGDDAGMYCLFGAVAVGMVLAKWRYSLSPVRS